jgi:hypothetical protein
MGGKLPVGLQRGDSESGCGSDRRWTMERRDCSRADIMSVSRMLNLVGFGHVRLSPPSESKISPVK